MDQAATDSDAMPALISLVRASQGSYKGAPKLAEEQIVGLGQRSCIKTYGLVAKTAKSKSNRYRKLSVSDSFLYGLDLAGALFAGNIV